MSTSSIGGVPLRIHWGLYNGTPLGGTTRGNPGGVSRSGPVMECHFGSL